VHRHASITPVILAGYNPEWLHIAVRSNARWWTICATSTESARVWRRSATIGMGSGISERRPLHSLRRDGTSRCSPSFFRSAFARGCTSHCVLGIPKRQWHMKKKSAAHDNSIQIIPTPARTRRLRGCKIGGQSSHLVYRSASLRRRNCFAPTALLSFAGRSAGAQ
jgi:hypothetical protein